MKYVIFQKHLSNFTSINNYIHMIFHWKLLTFFIFHFFWKFPKILKFSNFFFSNRFFFGVIKSANYRGVLSQNSQNSQTSNATTISSCFDSGFLEQSFSGLWASFKRNYYFLLFWLWISRAVIFRVYEQASNATTISSCFDSGFLEQ